jgi:hypothetical protein
MPPGKKMTRIKPAAPRRNIAQRTITAVRRAVAGTLNREVEVAVERMEGGRFTVKLLEGGRASSPIRIEGWEMDAMRKVTLIPAHKRGIFFRHYAMLQGRP